LLHIGCEHISVLNVNWIFGAFEQTRKMDRGSVNKEEKDGISD